MLPPFSIVGPFLASPLEHPLKPSPFYGGRKRREKHFDSQFSTWSGVKTPSEKEKEEDFTPQGRVGETIFNAYLSLVDRLASFLTNRIFLPYPRTIAWGGRFFKGTSSFTAFFLFDTLGRQLFFAVPAMVIVYNRDRLGFVCGATLRDGWHTFFSNCWTYLHPSFHILLLFLTLLGVAVIVNTALVFIPIVKEYILLNYGMSILKDRGYNSGRKSIAVFTEGTKVILAVSGVSLLAGSVAAIHSINKHDELYRIYLDTQAKNHNVSFSPPPPPFPTFASSALSKGVGWK